MTRLVVGDDRSQSTLFPERLEDYLAEDNPVLAPFNILSMNTPARMKVLGMLGPSNNPALLQRVVDRRELGIELCAEPVHDRNDSERNTGCDEAILDGGGAGVVGEKPADGFHEQILRLANEQSLNLTAESSRHIIQAGGIGRGSSKQTAQSQGEPQSA